MEEGRSDPSTILTAAGAVLQPSEEEGDGYLRARVEETPHPHERDDASEDGEAVAIQEEVARTLRLVKDDIEEHTYHDGCRRRLTYQRGRRNGACHSGACRQAAYEGTRTCKGTTLLRAIASDERRRRIGFDPDDLTLTHPVHEEIDPVSVIPEANDHESCEQGNALVGDLQTLGIPTVGATPSAVAMCKEARRKTRRT